MTASPGLRQDLDFFILACRSEGRSPVTIQDYRRKAERLVAFLEGQGVQSSSDVTPTHVRQWMLALSEGMQMSSVGDYMRVVRRWFNWMVKEGLLPASPTAHVSPPRAPVHVIQPLSLEQIQDMLTLCEADSGTSWLGFRNRAMLLVMVDTGMRRSEISRMMLGDFNDDFDRIRVRAGKTHEERIVALHPTSQRAVLRYLIARSRFLQRTGHLSDAVWLTYDGQQLVPMGITRMVTALGKRAGIQNVRCSPHTLRHTAGTMALLNGATERDVEDMLGHKSRVMVRRYTATVGSEHAAERHRAWSPVGRLRVR